MKEKLEILVVEDTPDYLNQAKEFFGERINSGAVRQVDYAETFVKVPLEKIKKGEYDFILSDIFIPEEEGTRTEPYGIKIGEAATEAGIPIVFVTDLVLHQARHDILEVLREKYNYASNALYSGPTGIPFAENKKPYNLAYIMGAYMKVGKDKGIFEINFNNYLKLHPEKLEKERISELIKIYKATDPKQKKLSMTNQEEVLK